MKLVGPHISLRFFLGAMVLSAVPLQAQSSSEEQRFYNIYQTYHSHPTDAATWDRLTSSVAETYRIQSGDNLWVISQILFGDGNYWPKVWSINSLITNPHLIESGNTISFRLGTAEAQPSFFISEDQPDIVPYADPIVLTADSTAPSNRLYSTKTLIPPPEIKPKPVLKSIPPSLPNWSVDSGNDNSPFDNWGLEVVSRPVLKTLDRTFLQSYIKEGPIDFIGEVVEALEDEDLMVEGQVTYLKIRDGMVKPGDRITVVQNAGAVDLKALKLNDGGHNPGYVIRVAGELEISTEIEVPKPVSGFTFYRARVKRSLDIIQRGFPVLAGSVRVINHAVSGRMVDQSVAVIGGHLDNQGLLFSTGNLVYLDKGSSSGLAEGDIIPIQRTKIPGFRDPAPLIPYSTLVAGHIQIVDVQNQYATAVVLSNADSLRPGDGNRRAVNP